MSVSILILTHNEEKNIQACMQSVSWSDDIHVFDSFSNDTTLEKARSLGAKTFQHPFENYGLQREAARKSIPYKYPWVLSLDADERVDDQLASEIQAIAAAHHTPHKAYRMRRKDYFMGSWIKYSTLYPSWFIRLYRHADIHYPERSVHEYPVVNGSIGELRGHLLHHSFNKGMSEWMSKHNRYSELEATEAMKDLSEIGIQFDTIFDVIDPVKRRRILKKVSHRLPLRPILRFLYMYVLRRGFLDGRNGIVYCTMLAFYELLIVLKIEEMKKSTQQK